MVDVDMSPEVLEEIQARGGAACVRWFEFLRDQELLEEYAASGPMDFVLAAFIAGYGAGVIDGSEGEHD